MSSEKREDTESSEEKAEKIVIDRVIQREVLEADSQTVLDKLETAATALTAVLGEERISTDPVDLKPYGKEFYAPVGKEFLESVTSMGILVLPATEEEVAAVVRIANEYSIPVASVAPDTKMKTNSTLSRVGAIIMDTRLMGKKISKPVDIPTLILRFILERWSDHLKPVRQRFVEAGLVGKSFTEKAPDMPLDRLNYSFTRDGTWKFDFKSKKDTGQTIITYKDFYNGYRALADRKYDYMKALQEGIFKIEPSADDALKMAHLMPDMIEAFIKAIRDAEKKFKVELPKY